MFSQCLACGALTGPLPNTQEINMAHIGTSGIQQHSAGKLFPFVIARQEEEGRSTAWIVIGPGVTTAYPWLSYELAAAHAANLKAALAKPVRQPGELTFEVTGYTEFGFYSDLFHARTHEEAIDKARPVLQKMASRPLFGLSARAYS